VWWVVWVGIGAVLLALLAISWWLDRDARRRGATPLGAGEMSRGRRARDRGIEQEVTQVSPLGLTPRSEDAVRDIWRGHPR
jgi:hypothetical protein